VITFFKDQAELFKEPFFSSLEIDMNFKHIYGTKEHEVIFGVIEPQANIGKLLLMYYQPIINALPAIPIVRAIMNAQTTAAYQAMFTEVFTYLERAYDIPIRWHHIHGEGIQGVTLDQDMACIKGINVLIMHY
jgi:hypothetical protein